MLAGAAALAMSVGSAGTAVAAPATITVAPAAPNGSTCFPMHIGAGGASWLPNAAFVYKNIPAFSLRPDDVLAFDSAGSANDTIPQLQISLAPTTTNGGDVPATAFVPLVANTTPASSTGDSAIGNFDLRYKVSSSFDFAGGGLVIRFSNPAGAFAGDTTCAGGLNAGSAGDPSGFFVKRAYQDADGTAPWSGQDGILIGGFQANAVRPCRGQNATIVGTDGNDTLTGTAGNDVISSGAGTDAVDGLGGRDLICGGGGPDRLLGGPGADGLSGEAGKDSLNGGAGKDILQGGAAKDKLKGGPGADKLRGGKGKDKLNGGPGRDDQRQ
jgi:Ca2+-binding RTX toxin-like protein